MNAGLPADRQIAYVSIPSNPGKPRDDQVKQFLGYMIERAQAGPIFVHCKRGADRTGFYVACYRVIAQHWTVADALAEMEDRQFGHSQFFYGAEDDYLRMRLSVGTLPDDCEPRVLAESR